MPILDGRQSRPNPDNTVTDDRKNITDRPRPIRKRVNSYESYGKKHYEKNKAYYVAKAAENRRKNREVWASFKNTLSCQHCGENHPATFDFHHVDRSSENTKVHKLLKNGCYKKAYEEIKKCIVLCANCHRKLHYKEEQAKKDPTLGGVKV